MIHGITKSHTWLKDWIELIYFLFLALFSMWFFLCLRYQSIFLQCRRHRFYLWLRKIVWRREWLPTLVFLTGKSHRHRSLVGYSPWSCKEPGTTEWLTLSLLIVHIANFCVWLNKWIKVKKFFCLLIFNCFSTIHENNYNFFTELLLNFSCKSSDL